MENKNNELKDIYSILMEAGAIVIEEYYYKNKQSAVRTIVADRTMFMKTVMKVIKTGHIIKIKNYYYELADQYIKIKDGYKRTGKKIVIKSLEKPPYIEITLQEFKKEMESLIK